MHTRCTITPVIHQLWYTLTLFNYKFRSLKSLLSLYTLTSTCIFSILFYIHFLGCWQEEFIKQSEVSLVGDHCSCYHNVNQEWYCKENLDSSHSKGVKRLIIGGAQDGGLIIEQSLVLKKTFFTDSTY